MVKLRDDLTEVLIKNNISLSLSLALLSVLFFLLFSIQTQLFGILAGGEIIIQGHL